MKVKRILLLMLAVMLMACASMVTASYGEAGGEGGTVMTFVPSEPYVYEEMKNGYWTVDKDKNEYYRYWLPTRTGYKTGDKLVFTTSGVGVEYIFDEETSAFVNGDKTIQKNQVTTSDPQATDHWTPEKVNSFQVKYQSYTASVEVTINPSNVTSIVYTPKDPYKYYENDAGHGQWKDGGQWFLYETPVGYNGDTLTVKTTEEPEGTDYVLDRVKGGFISESGDMIKTTEVSLKSDQMNDHWLPDKDNYLTVRYEKVTCPVKVLIEKSPLESISYTPKEPYKIVEGDYNYGQWRLDDQGHFVFVYDSPKVQDGDILTIKKKGQDPVEYVFDKVKYEFIHDDDSIIYQSVVRSIKGDWAPGTGNKVEFSYLDQKCEADVEIVENPVRSISYTPAEDVIVTVGDDFDGEEDEDYPDGWYFYTPNFGAGDILSVTTDEGTENYVCDYASGSFVCGDETIPLYQVYIDKTDDWAYGRNNELIITYKGSNVKVPVTVTENHDHEDFMVQVPKTEPTCAAYGYEAHYDCTKCGKHFTLEDDEYEQTALYYLRIAKKAHKIKYVYPKKASDKAEGNIKYWTCRLCGTCFSDAHGKTEIDKDDVIIPKNDMTAEAKKCQYDVKFWKKAVIKASDLYDVRNSKGALTYRKANISGGCRINVSKNGGITVKKGLIKGTYRVKVKITSAATAKYKSCVRYVTIKIKVK